MHSRLAGVAALLLIAGAQPAPAQSPPVNFAPLSIDRLYRLPWATGTSPTSPLWSPDSRQVAFLWNDDGGNFRDVWLLDTRSGSTQRVTRMPRPELPPDPARDVAKLEQVERAETDAGVSEVLFAPDGRRLFFTFHGGLFQVLPGGVPTPLADPQEGVSDAAVSEHGNGIAYLSKGSLRMLNDGAPKSLYAPDHREVSVESFVWSHDGRRIAFIEADESRVATRGIPDYLAPETRLNEVKRAFPGEPSAARRVGIVSVADAAVHWVSLEGDPLDEIFGLAFSPDGRSLLIDKSDLYIKDRRLLTVDTTSLATRQLLRETDPHNVTAEWWADWSPDGRGVYFISDRDNDYHVYFQPLAGGAPRRITTGHWAVFSASVSPGAHALYVVSNQGRAEERQVYRVPLAGGEARRITAAAGAHKPAVSPDGRQLADLFSNDVTPPELYLQPSTPVAGDPAPRRITVSPPAEFRDYPWIAARYVTFQNERDGTLLHARLTLPKGFDPKRRYPAILGSVYSNTVHNEWGGRIYHPTWAIDQFLAQQGYVIMNVDISGSSGYGKAFRQRIREDYGGIDVEDLASGVKYLVAQGFADPDRVGIWGSSYGGLLTATSMFSRPELYRAGVAGAPATSLFHAQTGEMRTMLAPQGHEAQYAKSSAFLKSGGLKGHLMIIHGMQDDTVLFKDSVVLQQRLILQGGDIDFVMLPDAPHGWDTRGLAQTRFAYHKLFDYFERYLKGAP